MVPDGGNGGPGPDPLVGGGFGIEIVDGAAGGVPAVDSVLGGPFGGIRNRLVELTVVQAGKGAGLIDYTGKSVGKRGMLNPVQDHRAYGHLSGIRLASGLGGYGPSQQRYVAVTELPVAAAALGKTQGCQGFGAGDAVRVKALLLLELNHGVFGAAAIDAVYAACIQAQLLQLGLNLANLLALGAVFGKNLLSGDL